MSPETSSQPSGATISIKNVAQEPTSDHDGGNFST